GGAALKDVVYCKRWLQKEANVDDRVVVWGESFGGYMALAAAAFTPTEFAANIDFFGLSDLQAFVERLPPSLVASATLLTSKFGDPKNPEHARYRRERSPIFHVDQVQRPVLVVQGDNDPRVPKDQSDRMVAALRE